jgi:hypothetical protein
VATKKTSAGYVKSARKSRVPTIRWEPLTFIGGWVTRSDGRILFVYVAPRREDDWIALAVEGPGGKDPQAALDDHGHRLIGEFVTGEAAQRAAERFARRWLSKQSKIEECACDEVAA